MRGKGAQKISRDKRGRASKAMWIFSEGEGSIFDVFGNPNADHRYQNAQCNNYEV